MKKLHAYVPGEQPKIKGLIKLNTNENPYPPSPRVQAAIEEYLSAGWLRKYPDPLGTTFRQTAAQVLGVDPDGILIGNGSDDILTIVTRAFVPEGGLVVSPTPSYLLYKTLADIQGARFQTVPFTSDWSLPMSSSPSMSGSRTSIRITSGCCSNASASASSPLPASTVRNPARRSTSRASFAFFALSSTIRTSSFATRSSSSTRGAPRTPLV